ncbi:MAG: sterol desaturase family protein [Polyangiales bacterium]
MHGLLEAYDDPRFLWFGIGTNVVSMAAFLLFAVPMSLVAWREPAWAKPYRIQSRRPRAQDLVGPSVRYWLLNNAILFVTVIALWPVLRHARIHLGPLPPWWVILGQIVFFAYLDDFLFYWTHRTLHENTFLWKRVHSIHHRIHTPWAITGHYMHPLEFLVTAGLMLIGPVLVGAHVATLYLWVIVRQWEAAEGHSGYDFPLSPTHLFPGSDGALHHDFHHAKVKGNYAGFFAYVDRLFGTFARDYAEARIAWKNRDRSS